MLYLKFLKVMEGNSHFFTQKKFSNMERETFRNIPEHQQNYNTYEESIEKDLTNS